MSLTLGGAILQPALRIAGITSLPGTTPSVDQFAELIGACNALMDSWNIDGTKIFQSVIQDYTLTSGQKIYTIGNGAQLNTSPYGRPNFIQAADFLFPGTPVVRRQVFIMRTVEEWESIDVQDISGAPCWYLYFDHGYDSNGYGQVYIAPQPPAGYSLELAFWALLKNTFVATSDTFQFPSGYQEALVYNLAVRAATLYPDKANISPEAVALAKRLAYKLSCSNTKPRALISDAADLGGSGLGLPGWGWWIAPG